MCLAGTAWSLAAQTTWTVDPTPRTVLTATTDDGEPRFGGVTWATRLPDGALVVADGYDLAIRIFDTDGKERRRFGRSGRGPGEFTIIGWVGRCGGEDLLVWDFALARLTRLNPDRGYVDSWTHPTARSSRQPACAADGTLAFSGPLNRTDASRPAEVGTSAAGIGYRIWIDSLDVHVYGADGSIRWTWPRVFLTESISGTFPDGSGGATSRPLGAQALLAFAGTTLVLVDAGAGVALTRSADGSVQVHPLARRDGPVNAADYEADLELRLRQVPVRVWERFRALAHAVPPPARYPPAVHAIGDTRGLVWLTMPPSPDGATALLAIDASGRRVARLTLPDAITVMEIGEDYVLGRLENEDGEHSLVVYGLRAPQD